MSKSGGGKAAVGGCEWLEVPAVISFLEKCLREPGAMHSTDNIIPEGGATVGHTYALVDLALQRLKAKESPIGNISAILYLWAYHLCQGALLGVPPPGSSITPMAKALGARLQRQRKRWGDEIDVQQKRLRSNVSAEAKERAGRELTRLRAEAFSKRLDARELFGLNAASPDAPPPPPPPPAPATLAPEDEEHRRAKVRLAVALGTHHRCGQASPLLILGGMDDVLRHITSFVEGRQVAWRPKPPDSKATTLARLSRWYREVVKEQRRLMVEVEAQSLRIASLEKAEREAARLARAAQAEAAGMKAALEQERAEAAIRETELKERHQREISKHLNKARREVHELEVKWQLKVNGAHFFERKRARDEAAEQRDQLRAARAEAAAAVASADELVAKTAAEVAQLEASLAEQQKVVDRLRNSRCGESLARQQQMEDEIRRLKERRTLGQRTLAEANLDRRRWQEAQKKADDAAARLKDFLARDEVLERADACDRAEAAVASLKAELGAVKEKLDATSTERDALKRIAEPPKSKFMEEGHFSAGIDKAGVEALLLGVAANKLPRLFQWAADLFDIKLPSRDRRVPGKVINGERTYVQRKLAYLPGKSHCKSLAAFAGQLTKLQVIDWMQDLLDGDESCCYLADGGESLQTEWIGQLLAKRGADGLLDEKAIDLSALTAKTADAQAARFREALGELAALSKEAGLLDDERREKLRSLKPSCSMNDRAANARKAARSVCGREDGDDDPTCAEHALVNILEEGRKAIDAIVRRLKEITDEQAALDADKIKALRTCVGWHTAPSCALIYMIAKYVALFSSKGYAIGKKFAEWMEAELAASADEMEALEGDLLGHVSDMQAIRGSRNYVFFLNAPVCERLMQKGSLLTYLEEEADLADSNAGGKLRHAIITGGNSPEMMAAVRAMAIIGEAVLWPALKALKPGADKHVFDVLPVQWPKIKAFLEAGAADPQSVASGALRLDLDGAPPAERGGIATRGGRAAIDMARIRGLAAGDPLVSEMLTAAFMAMMPATDNHAAEWLPGGKLCAEKLTPELRKKYDSLVATSTSVERIHAVGRACDEARGTQHDATRSGLVMARFNNLAVWLSAQEGSRLRDLMNVSRREAYKALKITMKQKRLEAGAARRATRQDRLAAKRAKRAKREAEQRRIESVQRATRFSELKSLRNDQLADQLKYYKLVLKRTGFTATQPNREAYIRQVQALMVEEDGSAANDLADGDSGIEGVNVQRRVRGDGSRPAGSKRKAPSVASWKGYEWDMEEEFGVVMLAGKRIADGKDYGDGGKRWKKGTVLYKVIWEGYPPDAATWEPPENIADDLIEAYEDTLDAEAEEDAESDDEDDDDDGEGGEAEPSAADGAEEGDESDDDEEDVEVLEVTKIIGHHVYGGAKPGSLYNVYVRVQYADGSTTGRGYVPSEPLLESDAGRVVIAEYAKSKAGQKISKYVPAM